MLDAHGKRLKVAARIMRKSTCKLAPLKGKRRFVATWTTLVQGGSVRSK